METSWYMLIGPAPGFLETSDSGEQNRRESIPHGFNLSGAQTTTCCFNNLGYRLEESF
jgi:hypothetical protein